MTVPEAPGPADPPTSTLEVITDLLGLRPVGGAGVAGGPGGVVVGAVPGLDAPRFLVPLGARRASASSCWSYNRLRHINRTRWQRYGLGALLLAGAEDRVVGGRLRVDDGPGSLVEALSEAFGEPVRHLGLGVGELDAVWKPTLHLFRADGAPLGFAKIGWNPLTTALVDGEAAALRRWAAEERPALLVPELLHDLTWRHCRVVVTRPFPRGVRRLRLDRVPSAAAVRTLDVEPAGPLADTAWAGRVGTQLGRGLGHPTDEALRVAWDRCLDRFGATEVVCARWHGDWVPWNLAALGDRLVAWDWEYSTAGMPLRVDEVHGAYQIARIIGGAGPRDAFAAAGAGVPELLRRVHALTLAARARANIRLGAPCDRVAVELLRAAAAVGEDR